MAPMREIRWHWDRGEHNRIPKCCRVWFFVRWFSGWVHLTRYSELARAIWQFNTTNYVRCPMCAIRGHRIHVHTCNPLCGSKYYSEET